MKNLKKQAGVTLIELIVGLVIIALIVAGALSLFGTASSAQSSTQMTKDLVSIQTTTKSLYMGQGSYGTAGSINNILVTAKRIPSTIQVDTTTTPNTLTHQLNGTMAIASTGPTFTITLTNIPTDVCMSLMNGTSNWASIKAGTAAARTTFPVTSAQSATDCATGTTMVFTAS